MSAMNRDDQQEVLSPWAEADPVPLSGISVRLKELENRTIGLFSNYKVAGPQVNAMVESKLKERFPSSVFTHFRFEEGLEVVESKEKARFEAWVKGADAVITAVGD